jgi:hypothetical protein
MNLWNNNFVEYNREHPYGFRTYIRQFLPWFLIDLGIACKGEDCEKVGAHHHWYNIDNENSGCYYCKVIKKGKLWMK